MTVLGTATREPRRLRSIPQKRTAIASFLRA